jgi:hypothetical protein
MSEHEQRSIPEPLRTEALGWARKLLTNRKETVLNPEYEEWAVANSGVLLGGAYEDDVLALSKEAKQQVQKT